MSPLGKASLHLSPTEEMHCANRKHGVLQVLGSFHNEMWAFRAAKDVTPITAWMIFTVAEPEPGASLGY